MGEPSRLSSPLKTAPPTRNSFTPPSRASTSLAIPPHIMVSGIPHSNRAPCQRVTSTTGERRAEGDMPSILVPVQFLLSENPTAHAPGLPSPIAAGRSPPSSAPGTAIAPATGAVPGVTGAFRYAGFKPASVAAKHPAHSDQVPALPVERTDNCCARSAGAYPQQPHMIRDVPADGWKEELLPIPFPKENCRSNNNCNIPLFLGAKSLHSSQKLWHASCFLTFQHRKTGNESFRAEQRPT